MSEKYACCRIPLPINENLHSNTFELVKQQKISPSVVYSGTGNLIIPIYQEVQYYSWGAEDVFHKTVYSAVVFIHKHFCQMANFTFFLSVYFLNLALIFPDDLYILKFVKGTVSILPPCF